MTSQWAAKRKLYYALFAVAFCLILILIPLFLFLNQTPTCSDGKKNQNEKGVDCGGVCTRICLNQISAPIVMWQRSFAVIPGVYNAVAYVQNPNVLSRLDNVNYVFRLYDKDNLIIAEKRGRTFLPANQNFAIFESGFKTGTSTPVRTTFEFAGRQNWLQNPSNYQEPSIVAENIVLTEDGLMPRVNALVHNKSLENIKLVNAVIIIYDSADNAIAASRTLVENIPAQKTAPITFTWPASFSQTAVRKEIILRPYPEGIQP